MQRKCKKCGKFYNVKLAQYVKVLWRRKMIFMCEACEELTDWREDEDIEQLNRNNFSFNECVIECFDYRIYDWIDEKIIKYKKYCELRLRDDKIYNCFPIDLKEDYLVCCKDEFNPRIEYGTHRMGDIEKDIPLNYIKGIKILDRHKDYYEPEVKEPVCGFKGVELIDGVLKAKDYIYELGIPYEEPQRIRPHTDYQDVYSHFCIRIEDVLNYRDFITSSIAFSRGNGPSEVRLFKVKGEGHCFKNTTNGWVSNKLTPIREVTREEIIEYFNDRPELKLAIEKYIEVDGKGYGNVWLEYTKADIKPYKEFIDDNEIENLLVKKCRHREEDDCLQDDSILEFGKCEQCNYYKYFMLNKKETYSYLTLRNAIRKGTFNEKDEKYQYLLEHNFESELEAIQRLLKYKLK